VLPWPADLEYLSVVVRRNRQFTSIRRPSHAQIPQTGRQEKLAGERPEIAEGVEIFGETLASIPRR
jgi:hypothetical protein